MRWKHSDKFCVSTPLCGYTSSDGSAATFPSRGRLVKQIVSAKYIA
ncbi:MAG: hypothetical protein Q4A46_04210 [Clostridia bacterium]|nr:hypothetical protein [Clostridia bacterium]MDO4830663.1 hypothetical protein [Clostridia bacterium]